MKIFNTLKIYSYFTHYLHLDIIQLIPRSDCCNLTTDSFESQINAIKSQYEKNIGVFAIDSQQEKGHDPPTF